jgi:hypothetical protein
MSELVCELHGEHFGCTFKPHPSGAVEKGIAGISVYKIFLDPLFWQALGKARRWRLSVQHKRRCARRAGQRLIREPILLPQPLFVAEKIDEREGDAYSHNAGDENRENAASERTLASRV